MQSKLYLVENSAGWVESPLIEVELRTDDKVIAIFESDLWYTAEEQFWRFDEFIYQQDGHNYCHYNRDQLKELHRMWLEQQ